MSLCDRAILIEDGKQKMTGNPKEVLKYTLNSYIKKQNILEREKVLVNKGKKKRK